MEIKGDWKVKIPKVIWRGSFSGCGDSLTELDGPVDPYSLLNCPKVRALVLATFDEGRFDIKLSVGLAHPAAERMKELGWVDTKRVHDFDMVAHKYLLSLDSGGYQVRPYWVLCTNTALLKQDGGVLSWPLTKGLKPWEHYIPVNYNLSNLLQRLSWAQQNDEEVQAMIHRARTFARTSFQTDSILLYFRNVLLAYAKRYRD